MQSLDPVEIRVLGCLLEKQQTTPDAYPLTLNSLRLACNQSTNREPVVDYDEATVRDAAQRLGQMGWTRMASYHGSRAAKYRHLLDDALGLAPDERAVLCVLMLRGPQTAGELKQRTERMHAFPDLQSVEDALDRLTARELGRWRDRRPGQKEARYSHLLQEESVGAAAEDGRERPGPPPAATAPPDELAQLRRDIEALRDEVAAIRAQLGPGTAR